MICHECNHKIEDGFQFAYELDGKPVCGGCYASVFQIPMSERVAGSQAVALDHPSPQPDNSHYTKGGIEPWQYIHANDLNFFEGSVVKYITRWRHKNGIEDLRKARVYIDELIRQEEEK